MKLKFRVLVFVTVLFVSLVPTVTVYLVLNNFYNPRIEANLVRETEATVLRARRFIRRQSNLIARLQKSPVLADRSSSEDELRNILNFADETSTQVYFALFVDLDGRTVVGSKPSFTDKLTQKNFEPAEWFQEVSREGNTKPVFKIQRVNETRIASKLFPSDRSLVLTVSAPVLSGEERVGYVHVLYDWDDVLDSNLLATNTISFLFDESGKLIGSNISKEVGLYEVGVMEKVKPPSVVGELVGTRIKTDRQVYYSSGKPVFLVATNTEKEFDYEPRWSVVLTRDLELQRTVYYQAFLVLTAQFGLALVASFFAANNLTTKPSREDD